MSDLERRAVKGVFWTVIQSVGGRGLSLAVFVILARLLTPADFGLVAMAGVFIALLEVLVRQGFSTAITQREHLEPAHESTAFWTNIVLSALMGAALWASAGWVAKLYHAPDLAPVVRWLSAILPLRALVAVPVGLLQRRLEFRLLAVRSIFGAFVGGVAGVVAAFAGWGVYALVVQQLLGGLAEVLAVWGAAAWWPRLTFSMRHLRDLLGFSLHLLGASLLDFLNRRSDDFLIGMFLGGVALGYYAVAYRVLGVMTQVMAKTGTVVAFSAFSRLQREPDRMREAFYRSTQAASVVATPVFIGVSVVAPTAVPLIFGEQFTQSGIVLRILALIGVVHAISYYNFAVYVGIGRPDIRLKLLTVHTTVNVVAFFIAVRWGIVAVAAAYVIRAYVLIPLDLFALRHLIGVSPRHYFRNFAPAALSSALMVVALGVVQRLSLGPAPELFLSIAVGAAVYSAGMYLLAPALVRELWSKVTLMLSRQTAS
ncbi:MAG: lipopolysaccharide biosynthesis protein [Deltaproteobacteria bacterium]|nr:lipopolysaccharide biosynthesis protein [Deltaproteobacteria bacterium]MBW2403868.1 lipopolysaccharide biosynthesis protein [Deltaproteobacteria bacterium]